MHKKKMGFKVLGKSCDHAENMIKLGIETATLATQPINFFYKVHD